MTVDINHTYKAEKVIESEENETFKIPIKLATLARLTKKKRFKLLKSGMIKGKLELDLQYKGRRKYSEQLYGNRLYNAGEMNKFLKRCKLPKLTQGTSLAGQWIRLCFPKQGTWVQFLVEVLRSHMPYCMVKT